MKECESPTAELNTSKPSKARRQPAGAAKADAACHGDLDLARAAKALGHPLRVRILRLLLARYQAQGAGCQCGDLVDALPLAQSTVSQHLKVLKEAGLVEGSIDGPRVNYCLNIKGLRRFEDLVARFGESLS